MGLKQSIPLTSVRNARELGGYNTIDGGRVKSGLLLRTAKLAEISDKDIKTLVEKYNVGDVVDFRFDMEMIDQEDKPIGNSAHHQLDVMDLSGFDAESMPDDSTMDFAILVNLMEQIGMTDGSIYISFLENEKGRKGYGKFFRILLESAPDRAVLWHCTSGKDRTGLAAMLILSALGVDEETIISDYILTNTYNQKRITALKEMLSRQGYDDEFVKKAPLVFEGVNESFMRNAISHLKSNYGSVNGYIREVLGVNDNDIKDLKKLYLDR